VPANKLSMCCHTPGVKPKEHSLDLHLEHGEKWSVRYMSSMRWESTQVPTPAPVCNPCSSFACMKTRTSMPANLWCARSCCKFCGAEWQEVAARLEELSGAASPSMQVVLAREPCVDNVTGGNTTRCVSNPNLIVPDLRHVSI